MGNARLLELFDCDDIDRLELTELTELTELDVSELELRPLLVDDRDEDVTLL